MDSAQCCAVMFMLLGEPRILFRMVQIRMMEREKAIDPGDSKQQAAKSHLESGACREADNGDGCASTSDHIASPDHTYTHARTHRSSVERAIDGCAAAPHRLRHIVSSLLCCLFSRPAGICVRWVWVWRCVRMARRFTLHVQITVYIIYMTCCIVKKNLHDLLSYTFHTHTYFLSQQIQAL
jgi:hypothetical protein